MGPVRELDAAAVVVQRNAARSADKRFEAFCAFQKNVRVAHDKQQHLDSSRVAVLLSQSVSESSLPLAPLRPAVQISL